MKITKLGHCCLLIETKGKRILTDPGSYTIEAHSILRNIDFILFTHEHPDHFHIDSLKIILANNPQVAVYANDSVSDLLAKENIKHTKVSHGEKTDFAGIEIAGIGQKHALIHRSLPLSSNIGFFIDKRLWYPGDAFTDPERPVEILALPVSGPWLTIGQSIDYALAIKPKIAFPVHDGIRFGTAHRLPAGILPQSGIEFTVMVDGDSREF